MQDDMMKKFNEMSQNAISSANELVELNTRILNQAIERQLELGTTFVEGSKKQAELIQTTKDPKELVELQTKLAEEYSAVFLSAAKENMTIAQNTSEQYKTWFEKNATAANPTAPKTAKRT